MARKYDWARFCFLLQTLLALFVSTRQDYPFSIRTKGGYLSWRKQRQDSFKLVCYMTNWAQYRPEQTKFTPNNIDPFLCTHLIYAFAAINNVTHEIKAFEWNDESKFDEEERFIGRYEEFNNLKQINPSLKTLLAVGGWNMGSGTFSDMTRNETLRARFIRSTVRLLRKYKFDGLDIDWEFPAKREGSRAEDRQSLTLLVRDLRESFYNEAMATRQEQLLLSIAVAAEKYTILKAYDIPSIAAHLDFVSIMSYDYHGSWDKKLHHNSPLYASPSDNADDKKLTVDWTVRLYLTLGVPPEKLIVGLPYYGRSFTSHGKNERSFGAQATGDGKAGEATREAGFLSYGFEICKYIKEDNWTRGWSPEHQVPFAWKANQWVGYDDEESVQIKVRYIVKHCLGGAMIWSIDLDDFRSFCSDTSYPLTRAIGLGLKDMDRKRCAPLPRIDDYDVVQYTAQVTKWTDSPIEFTDDFDDYTSATTTTTTTRPTTKAALEATSKMKTNPVSTTIPLRKIINEFLITQRPLITNKIPVRTPNKFQAQAVQAQSPESLNNILLALQNSNFKTENLLDKVLLQFLVNITTKTPLNAIHRNLAFNIPYAKTNFFDSRQITSAESTTIVALASEVDSQLGRLATYHLAPTPAPPSTPPMRLYQAAPVAQNPQIFYNNYQKVQVAQFQPAFYKLQTSLPFKVYQPQYFVTARPFNRNLKTVEPNLFEKDLPKSLNQVCEFLSDGEFVRDPIDCGSFYTCFMGRVTKKQTCNPGLAFDRKLKVCNWKDEVNCQA